MIINLSKMEWRLSFKMRRAYLTNNNEQQPEVIIVETPAQNNIMRDILIGVGTTVISSLLIYWLIERKRRK